MDKLSSNSLYGVKSNEDAICTINVGGKLFQTCRQIFDKIPFQVIQVGKCVAPSTSYAAKEVFFDRDPDLFGPILNYFRFGVLHVPRHVCGAVLKEELRFWGVSECDIPACCWKTYVDREDEVLHRHKAEEELQPPEEYLFGPSCQRSRWMSVRESIWRHLYNSSPTRIGKVWAVVFYTFLLATVVCSFLEGQANFRTWDEDLLSCGMSTTDSISFSLTLEHYISKAYERSDVFAIDTTTLSTSVSGVNATWAGLAVENKASPSSVDVTGNKSIVNTSAALVWFSSTCIHPLTHEELVGPLRSIALVVTKPTDVISYIGLACLIFFTIEFFLALLICRHRLNFLKLPMTILDMLYLLVAWSALVMLSVIPVIHNHSINMTINQVFDALAAIRVIRLFQMARHVKGIRLVFLTMKASAKVLVLLLFVLLVLTTVIVDFMMKAEFLSQDKFDSPAMGYWWAIVTLTTVGYGDVVPTTAAGYIVGGVCAFFGPIVISFFVPIVSSNFSLYYGYKLRPSRCKVPVINHSTGVPESNGGQRPTKNINVTVTRL